MKYADYHDFLQEVESVSDSVVLILDGVEDPHNLGAIIRTAEAAGVTGIIIPNKKAVQVTDTVHRVSTGAANIVPVAIVANLVNVIKEFKKQNWWVTAIENGEDGSIYDVDLTGKTVIVAGSEGQGISRLVKETCDHVVQIPMLGSVSSLNVSVSVGIALFETVRQRTIKEID